MATSDYVWHNDLSEQFLRQGYLLSGQTLDERVDIICRTAETIQGIPGLAARLKENIKKGWYSLSTPIWCNFGTERALGISCYNSWMADDSASIIQAQSEVCMMTKQGGGTSAYFGKLRGRGSPIKDNGESAGAVHFMGSFENAVNVWSQGKVRRGNFAAYLDIDHPDIWEFLGIRGEGHPLQHISFGVCVPNYWMEEMIAGDSAKRKIWAKVIEARFNTGYPYVLFIDNVNNNKVDVYKDLDLWIASSNLCIETTPTSNHDESFVCDLASMNIVHFDDWEHTDAVQLLVYLLDAVMSEFIRRATHIPFMQRAVNFAQRHRALGIGWIGYHTYLQSKMIPFESMTAKHLNVRIAANIQQKVMIGSRELAQLLGEPELLKGYGRRHTLLTAIAPTKSSSFILGQVSEGIEPERSNFQIKDLAKGKFSIKNRQLEKLLESKGKNTPEVWDSILKQAGSVQHLNCLDAREKAVFKTFAEISPMEVVVQAAQRQKHIDQSQSLNLMISPTTPVRDVNALMIEAWRLGVKSLYYQIGVNAAQQFAKDVLACSSCEA